jgi:AcrR family transcriptional regulator
VPPAKSPPTKRNPTPRRGRTRALDRPKIVGAARALARQHGAAGLTMRGIARHLGVDPAALYWHFEDKATLLDAIARSAADERALEIPDEGPWPERARALAQEIRDRLSGEPALGIMGHGDVSNGPFIAKATGLAARVIAESGLRGEALFYAAHTFVHTVTAVLAARTAQAGSGDDARRQYARILSAELPGDEAGLWAEVARQDPDRSFDAYFDQAVDILVAGIGAIATTATD